jgi:hypothetical protein
VAGVAAENGQQLLDLEPLLFGLAIELGEKTRHLLHGHPVAALTRRRLELDPTPFDTETLTVALSTDPEREGVQGYGASFESFEEAGRSRLLRLVQQPSN